MITGLNLIAVPVFIISVMFVIPSFFNLLNSLMSTMPFNTATPNNAMKPTPAEILKGIPRIQSAIIPPIADRGIAVKMSRACLTDENVRYNRKKISNKATGTAMLNRALAACKFSKVPPYVG